MRKNLREYSRQFEEADVAKKSSADKAVVEARRQQLEEWLAYRRRTTQDLLEDRRELGLPDISEQRAALEVEDEDDTKVVEEIVEEILEESEEIIE